MKIFNNPYSFDPLANHIEIMDKAAHEAQAQAHFITSKVLTAYTETFGAEAVQHTLDDYDNSLLGKVVQYQGEVASYYTRFVSARDQAKTIEHPVALRSAIRLAARLAQSCLAFSTEVMISAMDAMAQIDANDRPNLRASGSPSERHLEAPGPEGPQSS